MHIWVKGWGTSSWTPSGWRRGNSRPGRRGSTDAEGNPMGIGNHDPSKRREVPGARDKHVALRHPQEELGEADEGLQASWRQAGADHLEQLGGAGVSDSHVRRALMEMRTDPGQLGRGRAEKVRQASPGVQQAHDNRGQQDGHSAQGVRGQAASLKDETVIPVSGAAEIALRMAEKAGLIKYKPGDQDFEIKGQLSRPKSGSGEDKGANEAVRRHRGSGVHQPCCV